MRPRATNLKPFISESAINVRVNELGKAIRRDMGNGPITCVCVLKGAFFFAADLMRAIGGEVKIEFLHTVNVQDPNNGSFAKKVHQFQGRIEGQNCIVVEDIIDTGITLKSILVHLRQKNPKSLKSVALLDKPNNRETKIEADYIGFSIPNEFVVGYGLDLYDQFRTMKYISAYMP